MSRYITLLIVVAASLCLANSNFLLAEGEKISQKIDVDTLKQPNDPINYKLTLNQTLSLIFEGFNLVKEPTPKDTNFTELFTVARRFVYAFQTKKTGENTYSMNTTYIFHLIPKKEGNFSSTYTVVSKNGTETEKKLDVKIDFEIINEKPVSNNAMIFSIAKLALVVTFVTFCF